MQPVTQRRDLHVRGYELLGALGEGATSQVFLARRRPLFPVPRRGGKQGKTVAIKVLRPGVEPFVRSLFTQERVGLRAGLHRQIPSHVRSGKTRDGDEYVIMEVIRGIELARSVEIHGGMAPVDVAYLARDVASVLKTMHTAGYVHRDIKLRNLMLSMDAEIYVADLGSVALPGVAYPISNSENVFVSPAYASPQAVRGEAPQPSDDVFSLGVAIVQMLARHPPAGFADINHASPRAIGMWAAVGGVYADVLASDRLFAMNIDKDLLGLAVRCMHPRADKRPTAADVEAELGDYLQQHAPDFVASATSVGRHAKDPALVSYDPLSRGNAKGGVHRNVPEETQSILTIEL